MTESLQTQKAGLAQQQRQLAEQLATTRESSGRQEAGQITATAATQEQEFWTGLHRRNHSRDLRAA